MATSNDANPRRKPVTYGKASRRSLIGCPNSAPNAIAGDIPQPTERRIAGKVRKENVGAIDFGHDQPDVKVKGPYRLDYVRATVEEPVLQVSAMVKKSRPPANLDHSLYDVPSSDEDYESLHRHYGSTRKRRKTRPAITGGETDVVYDDDSLQRHISAQFDQDSQRHNILDQYPVAPPRSMKLSEAGRGTVSARDADSTRLRNTKRNQTTTPVLGSISDGKMKNTILLSPTNLASLSQSPISRPKRVSQALTKVIKDPAVGSRISKSCRKSNARSVESFTNLGTADALILKPQTPARIIQTHPKVIEQPTLNNPENISSPSGLDILGLHVSTECQHTIRLPFQRIRLVDRLHDFDNRLGDPTSGDDSQNESLNARNSLPSVSNSRISTARYNISEESLSGDSQIRRSNTHNILHPGIKPPMVTLQGGLKKTYARQRSYLTESDVGDDASFNVPLTLPTLSPSRSSRRSQNAIAISKLQAVQHLSVDTDNPEDAYVSSIRSIHELRQAGGNARVVGEMEAILDDLDDQANTPLSLKRSGLLDLTEKLGNPASCRSFIHHGLEARLLTHVNSSHDVIVNVLLMLSLTYLIAESFSPHALTLINNQQALEYFATHLHSTDDFTSLIRGPNVSKITQVGLLKLCDSLLQSPIWRHGRPSRLTIQILSLLFLEYLVLALREAGCRYEVFSQRTIDILVDIMVPSTAYSEIEVYSDTTVEVQLAVSILESTTTGEGPAWTKESTGKIIQILPIIETSSQEKFGGFRTLALRLCLNLTNNNRGLCEGFLKPEVIQAALSIIELGFHNLSIDMSTKMLSQELDILVLTLGLLINLAECTDFNEDLFIVARDGQRCPLDTLLLLFNTKLRSRSDVVSEKGITANVAFGYLSILLSYLSFNPAVRKRISLQLQGGTLSQMVDAVEEFLQYHRRIADEINQEIGSKAGFISRLENVVDRIKQGVE